MPYGICNLSIVPLRAEPAHSSEMTSQLLYGEFFEIKEVKKNWYFVKSDCDGSFGWIENTMLKFISDDELNTLKNHPVELSSDLVEFIITPDEELIPITIGAQISSNKILHNAYDGSLASGQYPKENLIKTAFAFLNAPFLHGGRSPFGIDAPGFVQLVYKLNGYFLFRNVEGQATQGEVLSFIEESEPGDLAFFDNDEGKIVHVGIIMKDNYLIHCHGKVRTDRLDHTGIFNVDDKKYSHKLRVIKKVI